MMATISQRHEEADSQSHRPTLPSTSSTADFFLVIRIQELEGGGAGHGAFSAEMPASNGMAAATASTSSNATSGSTASPTSVAMVTDGPAASTSTPSDAVGVANSGGGAASGVFPTNSFDTSLMASTGSFYMTSEWASATAPAPAQTAASGGDSGGGGGDVAHPRVQSTPNPTEGPSTPVHEVSGVLKSSLYATRRTLHQRRDAKSTTNGTSVLEVVIDLDGGRAAAAALGQRSGSVTPNNGTLGSSGGRHSQQQQQLLTPAAGAIGDDDLPSLMPQAARLARKLPHYAFRFTKKPPSAHELSFFSAALSAAAPAGSRTTSLNRPASPGADASTSRQISVSAEAEKLLEDHGIVLPQAFVIDSSRLHIPTFSSQAAEAAVATQCGSSTGGGSAAGGDRSSAPSSSGVTPSSISEQHGGNGGSGANLLGSVVGASAAAADSLFPTAPSPVHQQHSPHVSHMQRSASVPADLNATAHEGAQRHLHHNHVHNPRHQHEHTAQHHQHHHQHPRLTRSMSMTSLPTATPMLNSDACTGTLLPLFSHSLASLMLRPDTATVGVPSTEQSLMSLSPGEPAATSASVFRSQREYYTVDDLDELASIAFLTLRSLAKLESMPHTFEGREYAGFTHNDLKLDNTLLRQSDGMVGLCDFELVGHVTRDGEVRAPTLDDKMPHSHRAPEGLSRRNDVWAVGLLVAELYVGVHPLIDGDAAIDDFGDGPLLAPHSDEAEGIDWSRNLGQHVVSLRPLPPNHKRGESLLSFLAATLTNDAALRPTATELLKHPFVNDFTLAAARYKVRQLVDKIVKVRMSDSIFMMLGACPRRTLSEVRYDKVIGEGSAHGGSRVYEAVVVPLREATPQPEGGGGGSTPTGSSGPTRPPRLSNFAATPVNKPSASGFLLGGTSPVVSAASGGVSPPFAASPVPATPVSPNAEQRAASAGPLQFPYALKTLSNASLNFHELSFIHSFVVLRARRECGGRHTTSNAPTPLSNHVANSTSSTRQSGSRTRITAPPYCTDGLVVPEALVIDDLWKCKVQPKLYVTGVHGLLMPRHSTSLVRFLQSARVVSRSSSAASTPRGGAPSTPRPAPPSLNDLALAARAERVAQAAASSATAASSRSATPAAASATPRSNIGALTPPIQPNALDPFDFAPAPRAQVPFRAVRTLIAVEDSSVVRAIAFLVLRALCNLRNAPHKFSGKDFIGFTHNDLRLDNVLLRRDGDVVICDFELVGHIQREDDACPYLGNMIPKMPEVSHRAPEGYGTRSDSWTLGILIAELCTGIFPLICARTLANDFECEGLNPPGADGNAAASHESRQHPRHDTAVDWRGAAGRHIKQHSAAVRNCPELQEFMDAALCTVVSERATPEQLLYETDFLAGMTADVAKSTVAAWAAELWGPNDAR